MDPLAWIDGALAARQADGLLRRRSSDPAAGCVNFGANDYLGLAGDPRLVEAAAKAATRHGWGSGASPSVCGRSTVHGELEERLAHFEHAEAALLFGSGYAANSGVIPALAGEGDAIYSDEKNHASLIDGCRLSRAERHVYRHGDADDLARLLAQEKDYRRRLIVTDSLFSMDGDFAPIESLARLALEHDSMLLIDEAHATGVWGPTGRGLYEQLVADSSGLAGGVSVRIGTLSKALGASGGFVVGSARLIDWLHNLVRPYVYSTAPPPACAAAAMEGLRIAETERERREGVKRLAERLRHSLAERGWDTGRSESQIVPVYVGAPERAVALSAALRERKLFVPAIRPPSVPPGESLLRVSLSASHTAEQIDRLVETLESLRP